MAQAAATAAMFVWEGKDKQGRSVKGEMSGASDAVIKATLRRQGINPIRVKKKPKSLFGAGGKAINAKDISVFSRQMSTMMSAGVPLVQSFEIVGRGHENPARKSSFSTSRGKSRRATASATRSPSTHCTSTISTSTWSRRVRQPVFSKICSTRSRPTRKRQKRSRARSRKRCSTPPRCW